MCGALEALSVSVIGVIPARYASSRFPGKPLALIAGRPMIQWVYEQAQKAPSFEAVIVATDDERIREAVEAFGGQVMMTSPHHASGTDRVWEVAQQHPNAQYVFNIQGDEPLMNPDYLEEAIQFLKFHHDHADIITLKVPLGDVTEREDPNVVKVVTSHNGKALYFSRAPIPFARDAADGELQQAHSFRHIGVYGFTRQALEQFVGLPMSPLEQIEKLEQLRAMEAGMQIYAITVPQAPLGVDTPEDLEKVQAALERQQV